MSPALAAAVAGACAAIGLVELARLGAGRLTVRAPGALASLSELVSAVTLAGSEGREPGGRERLRLLALGGVAAALAGAMLAGPLAGALLGAAGPYAASRVLRARREGYRAAVEEGAPALALALADGLRAGHSLRGAVAAAAEGLPGAAGHELRRVAAELRLGASTDDALEGMRARCRSHPVEAIVAATLLQRRAGGNLATLLRDSARSFEDHARSRAEARAATAQARFTGLVVVLMPAGAGLLAELASPGYLATLAGSFLTAWLAGLALVMQAVAAVLIRRLGRTLG
ncbi:MAG TPA: type II secretion system F family protein [Thermoleophilaceae bacterium]|nr:type II secretion system F family protein [Thermoleophilaceae bacterium]